MICSNCGTQNNGNGRFCKNCGTLLEIPNQQTNNINQQNLNQQSNQSFRQNEMNEKYINNAVNPGMKKWAIWSIIIPIIGIIFYIFIGLSFILAIILASAGFSFAKKGEMWNPKVAIIGKVLNGILVGIGIVTVVVYLVSKVI